MKLIYAFEGGKLSKININAKTIKLKGSIKEQVEQLQKMFKLAEKIKK